VGVLAAIAAIAVAQGTDEVRVSAHTYMSPQVHLTAQTNLVQLEVVVRDPRGHAAGGLKRTDFEVLDEGKASDILAFSLETREAMRPPRPGRRRLMLPRPEKRRQLRRLRRDARSCCSSTICMVGRASCSACKLQPDA
jgi:hypothetical protein